MVSNLNGIESKLESDLVVSVAQLMHAQSVWGRWCPLPFASAAYKDFISVRCCICGDRPDIVRTVADSSAALLLRNAHHGASNDRASPLRSKFCGSVNG